MKKTYIQPTLEVVKICTAGMLAVSGTGISNTPADGDALSRGYNVYEDEDY